MTGNFSKNKKNKKKKKSPEMVSELEKQRLENIQRNNELLRQLELSGMSMEVSDGSRKKSSRPAKLKPKKKAARVKQEPEFTMPLRKSRRLEGKKADFELQEEDRQKEYVKMQELEEQQRARKEGEMKLSEIVKTGDWDKGVEVLSFIDSRVSMGDYFDQVDIKADGNVDKARKELSNLNLYDRFDPADIKLTSERIMSVGIHPTVDKKLVLAGDKVGELGIWDADSSKPADVKVEDGDDQDSELANIGIFKVHTRAIATILFDSKKPQYAFTGSYDGSIRQLDLSTGVSTEAYVYDSNPMHPVGISDFALPEPNMVYFTTLQGEFGIHDLREKPNVNVKILRLHDKKIGGFSVNPSATYQIATASLDRTLKLWDIRQKIDPSEDSVYDQPCGHLYGQYDSRLSVSCSDWNWRGSIVVNGYDDTINVFNFADSKNWNDNQSFDTAFKPTVRIKHNCQTGRWVSILKSKWQSRPSDGVDKFIIGNMKRYIDIYSSDGIQLAHLGHEDMGAVPAVVEMHPTQNWCIGGSASGKIYLWH